MRKKPHYSGPRNNNNNNNNNNKRRFVRKPGGGGGGRFGGGGGGHEDSDFVNPRMRKQAQTNREKYMNMAKDALSSGDRVESEYYLQHADHYLRIMNAIDAQFAPRQHTQQGDAGQASETDESQPGDEAHAGGSATEYDAPQDPQQSYAADDGEYDENAGAQLAGVLPAPKMAGV